MSWKAKCWDNAVAERFFATLMTELVYTRRFATRAEAREAIFDFIEVLYNRRRRLLDPRLRQPGGVRDEVHSRERDR
jgi:transposase InsO family protein